MILETLLIGGVLAKLGIIGAAGGASGVVVSKRMKKANDAREARLKEQLDEAREQGRSQAYSELEDKLK